MSDSAPEDDAWLSALVERSPVLPDRALRRHWQAVIPWLAPAERYALAAILLDVEHACAT
jgi:hypothetical protein